jgi:hypothetical protein
LGISTIAIRKEDEAEKKFIEGFEQYPPGLT